MKRVVFPFFKGGRKLRIWVESASCQVEQPRCETKYTRISSCALSAEGVCITPDTQDSPFQGPLASASVLFLFYLFIFCAFGGHRGPEAPLVSLPQSAVTMHLSARTAATKSTTTWVQIYFIDLEVQNQEFGRFGSFSAMRICCRPFSLTCRWTASCFLIVSPVCVDLCTHFPV